MNPTRSPKRSFLVPLFFFLIALAGVARAQDTFFLDDTRTFSRQGDVAYAQFTLGGTRTLVLRVVADYALDAGIFTPSNYPAFAAGQATSGYATFSSSYGTKSVTLAAGSYVVAVRNRTNGTNAMRYELDYDLSIPGQSRLSSQTEAEFVGANGGRLVQPFTIGSGNFVWIDGANLGLNFYLIPSTEVENFRAGRSFLYYSDYTPTSSSNQPGGFHVNLPPGTYALAFHNPNSIQKPVTYTIEWWTGGTTASSGGTLPAGGSSSGASGSASVAPQITSQPQGASITAGASATFTVSASGTAPFSYQWRKNGSIIPGATASTYRISSAQVADSGSYSVLVSNSVGGVLSNSATLTVTSPAPTPPSTPTTSLVTSRLGNLSVRTTLATAQTLIVGFTVSGGSKPILIRAAGPALGALGLSGFMPDPQLELYRGSVKIAENDDWNSSLSSVFSSLGAFAFSNGSFDAALVQTISGGHSVWARSVTSAGSGIVLVEAYDAGLSGDPARMTNLSARNRVGTGDNILIAGFAINGTGSKKVLIRAVGPTLQAFGVQGVLEDPVLNVYDSRGVLVGTNDNWGDVLYKPISATLDYATAAIFSEVGAFSLPSGSRDAALFGTLAAGATYTVQVSGANGGTGEALVEVYEVP